MRLLTELRRTLTPWGWGLLAVCTAAALGAAVLRWRELVFLSVTSFALLMIALPWVVQLRAARVRLEVPSARVPVGDAATALLTVHRPGRLAAPQRLELQLGDDAVVVELPVIQRGERHLVTVPIPTDRRGMVRVGPVRIVHGDPLGIYERLTELAGATTLMVHPRIGAMPPASLGLVRDLEGEAARDVSVEDVTFHSLREYRPGDDRRLVHWRASAKTGDLMVRQFEPSRRSDTVVLLSTHPDEVDAEDFELSLSLVATIAESAFSTGRMLRVLSNPPAGADRPQAVPTGTRAALLDALTSQGRDGAAPLTDAAKALPRRTVQVVWLVVGEATPPRRLRQMITALPAGAVPVVVRAATGAAPVTSLLQQTPVLTVGELGDFARLLAAEVGR